MAERTNRLLESVRGGGAKKDPSPLDRIKGSRYHQKRAETPFYDRVIVPFIDRVTDQRNMLMRNVDFDAIRYKLMRAGFPRGLNAKTFLFAKLVCVPLIGILAPFYFYLMLPFLPWHVPTWFLTFFIVFGGFLGFRLPDIWLAMQTRKRQFSIQMQLPDLIDLVAVSVEAGLGLYAAIQRVAMRFPGPLSDEFLRTTSEIRLGRTRVDAMRDMARRIDLTDLTVFITSLVQAEMLGLSVANVLRVQSERLRERRRQRAREQAQKAPLKMMLPLVFFIFPALFVVILGPALIRAIASGY